MRYKLHVIHFNQPDLLARAVHSTAPIECLHIWSNGVPKPMIPAIHHELPSLSYIGAVNHLLHSSWDDDVMFWIHDDIECDQEVAADFFRHVQRVWEIGGTWGYVFAKYDALCAFNCAAIRHTGYYDNMFYWNYADTDYHCRMRRAGWDLQNVERYFANRIIHHGDSSHRADPALAALREWRGQFGQDKAYYEWKHGGPPGLETR
jgi:hypothetical protein